jgi:hypothetical protein
LNLPHITESQVPYVGWCSQSEITYAIEKVETKNQEGFCYKINPHAAAKLSLELTTGSYYNWITVLNSLGWSTVRQADALHPEITSEAGVQKKQNLIKHRFGSPSKVAAVFKVCQYGLQ